MFDNFLSAPLTVATWQIIYWASKTPFSHIINEGHSEEPLEISIKKAAPKNFAIFTRKHLYCRPEDPRFFLVIFENTNFEEHNQTAVSGH